MKLLNVAQPEHKTRVRALAAAFSQYSGREPLELAMSIHARLEYGNLGDKDGMFDPVHQVILISKNISLERQRFTVAHEVIHALILKDEDLLSDLHDAYEGDALENAIEALCNIGASEILVPATELTKTITQYGLSAQIISRIAQTYSISRMAACVTLAQHMNSSSIITILRAKGMTKKWLEVEFSVKTETMKYALAIGTLIPAHHVTQIAFETGFPMCEQSFIPFRSGKNMDAVVNVFPEGNKVYAIFTVARRFWQ